MCFSFTFNILYHVHARGFEIQHSHFELVGSQRGSLLYSLFTEIMITFHSGPYLLAEEGETKPNFLLKAQCHYCAIIAG